MPKNSVTPMITSMTSVLLAIMLLLCPMVVFAQNLVGKIPIQERKIKIRQIEERSGRVQPTPVAS